MFYNKILVEGNPVLTEGMAEKPRRFCRFVDLTV